MIKFWEYPLTFQDPGSVYAYHLFSVHHDIIWFLIIILILVYWCLYKVLSDFNWHSFNNNNSGVIQKLWSIFFNPLKHVTILIGWFWANIINLSYLVYLFSARIFYIKLYKLLKIRKFQLGWLNYRFRNPGEERHVFLDLDFICFWIAELCISPYAILSWLLGTQWTTTYPFSDKKLLIGRDLIDVDGKVFARDEYNINRLFLTSKLIKELTVKRDLSYKQHTYLYIDKQVTLLTYHYTTPAYFYTGCVDTDMASKRKEKRFLEILNLGIFSVMNLLFNQKLKLPRATRPIKATTIRDTFFESQEFKHSFLFELVWAIFPTVIIVCILIPSLYLLYSLDEDLDPKLTLKVIGHQWYWSYEFNNWVNLGDEVNYEYEFISYKFDSNIILTENLEFGTKRLLEVDKRLILPINVTLRFLITSGDVLHAWAVPELGLKMDAVPGRLNQILSFITRPGVFYGQCSELCGASHGFMPIVVVGVDYANFIKWIGSI